jgi:hypothetical protein
MTTRSAEREQFLADIITAAVEGGTGYWAQCARYKWEGLDAKDVHAVLLAEDDDDAREKRREAGAKKRAETGDGRLTVDEALAIEGGGALLLNIDAVARGIGRITRGEIQINASLKKLIAEASRENDAGDIDADAADAIAQAALLGELTYG